MKPPSRACRTRGISSAVASSRGTTSSAANRSTRSTCVRARAVDVDSAVVPTRAVPARVGTFAARMPVRQTSATTAGAASGPSRRPPCPRRGRAPAPRPRRPGPWARRRAGPGPRAGRAGSARRPTSGGRAGSRARGRPARRRPAPAPRTCRPSRIWTSLISQSQPSTCRRKSSNSVVVRALLQPEVVVQLRGLHQRPDLLADRRQLGRVQRGDVGVLVEQLLEPRDVAVGLGAGHRRDEVVDERGVRAALGLRALARVVDQERVDQRQVAERRVGAARRATSPASCRAATPGCRACPGARSRRRRTRPRLRRGEPAVGAEVVVAGRQVRVVVDRDRVLAEAARRLHHQHDVAAAQGGEDDVAVAVDVQLAGRRAPVRLDALAEVVGQRVEPAPVLRGRDPDRVAGQLLLGQPVGVLAAGLDQRVDQRVAVLLGDAGDRSASPTS